MPMLPSRCGSVARSHIVRCSPLASASHIASTADVERAIEIAGNAVDLQDGRRAGRVVRPRHRPVCYFSPPWPPQPRFQQQTRGARTRTTLNLEDLPQGMIDAEPLPPAEDHSAPAYPPSIMQARRNMDKFENCVLLTRVGSFYELYFEQATEIGPLLNLKVGSKNTAAGTVALAGFPFYQLDRFLKLLVQDLNRYVAIAEEFPNDASDKVKSGGLIHDRRVARVVTPGTLIDEKFMDPYSNNYILSIHLPEPEPVPSDADADVQEPQTTPADPLATSPVGVAWLDLSTGNFITQSTTLGALGSVLSRVSPKEIVLDKVLPSHGSEQLQAILREERRLTTYSQRPHHWTPLDWASMLESDLPPDTAATFTPFEVQASNLLLHYVKDRLLDVNVRLQPPRRHESMEIMAIDKNSMRSLEIKQTSRDGAFRGSLLHAVRRTVTRGGTRLLAEWLAAPSTSLPVIHARQDLVERLRADDDLCDRAVLLLRRAADAQRLVQKFALGRGDPDDLLDLARTVRVTDDLVTLLTAADDTDQAPSEDDAQTADCLNLLAARISLAKPVALAAKVRAAIDEDGLEQRHQFEEDAADAITELAARVIGAEGESADIALPKSAVKKKRNGPATSIREHYSPDNDSWIMKPAASRNLSALHAELRSLLQERTALATSLQTSLKAPSLTLKWTPGLGHICHVKGKDAAAAASSASASTTVSSSRSTRSFHHPEWSDLGRRLDHVRTAIRTEETRVLQSLRASVVRALVPLRRNAAVLDELDVAASMAMLAREHSLVRPVLNAGAAHAVIGGRHPIVESGLAAQQSGRTFTGNDCFVGSPGHGTLWIITGPNMAGKSTFLRQNALITILAQTGGFVPADHAELGIVDALFSRVGSADDLYRDQSTFMVEMLETAQILRCATPRSLVIMDEIGRGTTPEDGAAVAFACVDHLVRVNRCRTLFATHFHTVADLVVARGMHVSADGSGGSGAVEMYCTDVEEAEGGSFVYVHKLRKGVNRHSHALKVARLAGLPEVAIEAAKQVLQDEFAIPVSTAS